MSNTVSTRLIALRKSNGWTVRELAEKVEVSHETIYTYERGVVPKLRYLKKLAQAFGVSIDFLVYGKADSRKKIETVNDFKNHCAITSKRERDGIIRYLLDIKVKKK
jgi:transcriptional regulator with XRE-family HTH domain